MAIGTVYGPPPTRNSGPGVVMLTWGVGAGGALAGAVGSLYNLCVDPRLNHEVEVQHGVMAEESAVLLQTFFPELR